MHIDMPERVSRIIGRLEDSGYEAFAVGGCVRDACLGRVPHDWDITTSASPKQVKALFRRTVDTGIAHGTVTVMDGDQGFEVTTYRIDGAYEDARHPSEVIFTPDLSEDLRRRDFTINAMAYSESRGLVDLFGGQQDLAAGVIRCVGAPQERFAEDALRIMRAVRFAAQLNFAIEDRTADAAKKLAENLSRISAERIQMELMKILESDRPEFLKTAWALGITAIVLPEFDAMMLQEQNGPHHTCSVGEHTLRAMSCIEADPVLRLTMLLHDVGKPLCARTDDAGVIRFDGHAALSAQTADRITRRLKFDRETMRRVRALTALHSRMPQPDSVSVRRMASEAGADIFTDYLKVKRADLLARDDETSRESSLAQLDQICSIWTQIQADKDPLTVADLAVSGKDLIRLGIRPGPALGAALRELLDIVLEDPSFNTSPELLHRAAAIIQRTHLP